MININEVSGDVAEKLCRNFTADLPEYFGLPEVNEHYAKGVATRYNFAAKVNDEYVGLISLEFPYPNNANIYWIAVMREFHNKSVGHKLIDAAIKLAEIKGASTMTVETLAPNVADANYLKTYNFYQKIGFAAMFNLKPQSYEWEMVYMVRKLYPQSRRIKTSRNIDITPLNQAAIPSIVKAFAENNWNKPVSLFKAYLKEQENNERLIWIAYINNEVAGYITLKWVSKYHYFAENNIAEIIDLNVLTKFRNMGIGSKLLDIAEEKAFTRGNIVGLGVGLYGGEDGGYGAAQRLYIKRGYIPDGRGVAYGDDIPAVPGKSYPLDDDLILRLTKNKEIL